jgi:hypothetical protein
LLVDTKPVPQFLFYPPFFSTFLDFQSYTVGKLVERIAQLFIAIANCIAELFRYPVRELLAETIFELLGQPFIELSISFLKPLAKLVHICYGKLLPKPFTDSFFQLIFGAGQLKRVSISQSFLGSSLHYHTDCLRVTVGVGCSRHFVPRK